MQLRRRNKGDLHKCNMTIFTLVPKDGELRSSNLTWAKVSKKDLKGSLLEAVTRMERKTFPSCELLDFIMELRKQNTTLCCMLNSASRHAEVIGYVLYCRLGRTTWLHKICVGHEHRRRGVASTMISALQKDLASKGCETLCLWVDEERHPARSLYTGYGFEEVERVEDYYGPRRTGLKLVLDLNKAQRSSSAS